MRRQRDPLSKMSQTKYNLKSQQARFWRQKLIMQSREQNVKDIIEAKQWEYLIDCSIEMYGYNDSLLDSHMQDLEDEYLEYVEKYQNQEMFLGKYDENPPLLPLFEEEEISGEKEGEEKENQSQSCGKQNQNKTMLVETFEESGIVENKTEMIEEFGNDF